MEEQESRWTVKWKKVASIKAVGQLETYDMEIDAPSHNYVDNGIITLDNGIIALDNGFFITIRFF